MNERNEKTIDQLVEEILTAPGDATSLSAEALDAVAGSLDVNSAARLSEEIELTAAAVMLAGMPKSDYQPMPAILRAKLAAQGAKMVAVPDSNVTNIASRRPAPASTPQPASNRWFTGLGWAAAAALLVALVLQPTQQPIETAQPDIVASRGALQQQPASVTIPWGASEIEAFRDVTGDVVWNNETQSGYMRLTGMPVNDPTVTQYQLWIVDPDRDANPIDGGVFDVLTAGGEVLIPIDAKLKVLTPAAFAITREQPGGVVVSAGPLLLVAAS